MNTLHEQHLTSHQHIFAGADRMVTPASILSDYWKRRLEILSRPK